VINGTAQTGSPRRAKVSCIYQDLSKRGFVVRYKKCDRSSLYPSAFNTKNSAQFRRIEVNAEDAPSHFQVRIQPRKVMNTWVSGPVSCRAHGQVLNASLWCSPSVAEQILASVIRDPKTVTSSPRQYGQVLNAMNKTRGFKLKSSNVGSK